MTWLWKHCGHVWTNALPHSFPPIQVHNDNDSNQIDFLGSETHHDATDRQPLPKSALWANLTAGSHLDDEAGRSPFTRIS